MSYVTIHLVVAAARRAVCSGSCTGSYGFTTGALRGNLAFAIAALGLACGAIVELGMLHANTPAGVGRMALVDADLPSSWS